MLELRRMSSVLLTDIQISMSDSSGSADPNDATGDAMIGFP